MSGQNQERIMRDEYELMGEGLDPRRIELGLSAANSLRDFIAQEYLPILMQVFPPHQKKIALHFSEQDDVLVFGRSFGPNLYDASDTRTESGFTGLKLSHSEDAWRLRLRSARYHHDGTPNRVATYYSIDTAESLVLKAQLETRVLTTDKDEVYRQAFDADALPPQIWRRIYERQLTIRDCFRLQERLRQTAEHCVALAG